jgi:hypothetical protein
MFSSAKKALTAGVAALTLVGAVASSTTQAQAQVVYYGPGYGGGYGGYGGYYGSPYYGASYYGGSPYYGRYYDGYYPRRRSNGGAIAAGIIGGLALGAIAAQAARPATRVVYRNCYNAPRRTVTRSGRVLVRNVRVCR